MLVALNAGNSHVLLGGYEKKNDLPCFTASLATLPWQTGDYYACMLEQVFRLHHVDVHRVRGAVISSVVPAMGQILTQALQLLGITDSMELHSGVRTGLNIRSEQPQQIGADRIACAVAVRAAGRLPAVAVSLGTATTFTVLDRTGALVGSAITAGIRLSLDALRSQAAQLPSVALETKNRNVLARNTADAMRVGAIYGAAALVDGMIGHFTEALGEQPFVVITGGNALLIEPYLHIPHVYDRYLLLNGLYRIWQRNQPS